MNIQTVAENLRNTIAGKEKMLAEQWDKMAFGNPSWQGDIGKQMAMKATIEFLKLNIDELKRILADVEVCMNTPAANSWAGQVDRQSGAVDESELRGRDGWM